MNGIEEGSSNPDKGRSKKMDGLIEAVLAEFKNACSSGQQPNMDEFCRSHPECGPRLRSVIEDFLGASKNTPNAPEGSGKEVHEPPGKSGPTSGMVLGDFLILREIGHGAMGTVYEAEQISLSRKVALKVLPSHLSFSDEAVRKFRREAEAGGRQSHPGIVAIHAVGEHEGIHYIAQELVVGSYTLADRLDELREDEQPPPGYFREVAQFVAAVADALRHAHESGVIHRDMKPSNILLSQDGQPKVSDFGLAKVVDALALSRTGDFAGTPYYMSPEQAMSRRMGIDHRTDIYSLGVTLYEMLTLRRPFEGKTSHEILKKIVLFDPVDSHKDNPRVPADLSTICLKAMEKAPEHRYKTMENLAGDLGRFLSGDVIAAKPAGLKTRFLKRVKRNPVVSTAVGMALIALLAFAVVVPWIIATSERSKREAEERARIEIEKQRNEAVAANLEAQQQAYVANINLAGIALDRNHKSECSRRLEMCPEELRGWEWFHLNLKSNPSLMTLHGQGRRESHVSYGRGGRIILSGYASKLEMIHEKKWSPFGSRSLGIQIWDAETGDLIKTWTWDKMPISAAAYHTKTERVAFGTEECDVRIHDLKNYAIVSILTGMDHVVSSLTFSPDGKRIATGFFDNRVFPFGVDTGRDREKYNFLDYSGIRVWDIEEKKCIATLQGDDRNVGGMAFSDDGKLLAACTEGRTTTTQYGLGVRPGSSDNDLRIWDVETGKLLSIMAVRNVTGFAVAFSRNKKYVVAGSGGNTIKIWSVEDGKLCANLKGHEDTITSIAISNDGSRIISGSADKTIRVWDARTSRLLNTLIGHEEGVWSVAISPDGKSILSGSEDETVRVWDVDTKATYSAVETPSSTGVWAIDSRSGSIRILSGWENLHIWDLESEEILASMSCGPNRSIECAAFSPDGRWVAVGSRAFPVVVDGEHRTPDSWDDNVKIWDTRNGILISTLRGHEGRTYCVAFSPDGEFIASGSSDNAVRLWNVRTGEFLHTLQGHESFVHSVAYSPNNQYLVSGGLDKKLIIWDLETYELHASLSGHENGIICLAISPDGKYIVSGGWDYSLKLWNIESKKLVSTLTGHTDHIFSVAFSPDGKRIVSGSEWDDRTVRIWGVDTGDHLVTLRGHEGRIRAVAFSHDNKQVITGDKSAFVHIWESEIQSAQKSWRKETLKNNVRPTVDKLFEQFIWVDDVIDALKKDTTMKPLHRDVALKLARARRDPIAYELNSRAWEIVKRRDASEQQYAKAFRMLDKAVKMEPRNAHAVNSLGVCQYRMGSYRLALETLTRSSKLREGVPEDLVFMAMAHHKLGNQTEAKSYLEKLRSTIKETDWGESDEGRAFIQEAEKLIEGEQ